MIKHWQSMHEYHCFLNYSKAVFDSSERQRLHSEFWIPWQKLRLFDSDRAMAFLESLYSHTGRPALNQPQILRSFVLFFLLLSMGLTPPSLTAWVTRLKQDRVLAALIGCPLSSLPPLGSYFDFMNRLWIAPSTDLYGRKKLLPASWNRKKPQKPKGKGQKAAEARPQITDTLSKRILSGKDILFNFESRLQEFFYLVAVIPSLESGLISSKNLTISGDGTAVHTHASPRGHRRKDAPASDGDADTPRHFSDPDASWGWDSDLDKYYYGYTLLKDRKIRAFIDLNSKCGRPKTIPDTIKIDKNGTPICQEGRCMVPNGYDKTKGYLMWRCPFGKKHTCKCKNSCSSAKYGRVIKTRPDWDIRLYTDVPRGTEAYKKIYNQRTATERINNRILNDYCLHRLMIHRKEHYSFHTAIIGICIHLDARYKQMQAAA